MESKGKTIFVFPFLLLKIIFKNEIVLFTGFL